MSRNKTKSSEKVLLAVAVVLVFGAGNFILWKQYRSRSAVALEKIDRLGETETTQAAAVTDVEFWKSRLAWLDSNMPTLGDSGTAQSELLEFLQESAAERKLDLSQPSLLKPEGGPHYHELAVTVRAIGPDSAVFRWLGEMQSPEKFYYVKTLSLSPDTRGGEPVMICTLTLARWFRK